MISFLLRSSVASTVVMSMACAADTVAVVNGQNVTVDDMNAFLVRINPQLSYDALKPEMKKKAVEEVVKMELLRQEALKSGIKEEKEYKAALAKVENEMTYEFWMQREFSKVAVSDDDIKKFYEQNKDKMKEPFVMHARHILVKTDEEAKKIIKELSAVKEKQEEAFAEAAKKYSQDPGSKENGGDLGFFLPQKMVKPFSEAAAKLKAGEMSKTPVKTDFGYHIIYKVEDKPERVVSFEEAKSKLELPVKQEKFKDFIEAKTAALKKSAKIEIK